MDLVQIREDILSRNATPLEKAHMFLVRGRALRLDKSQWQYFTHPGLPKEVEDASVFLQLPPAQQQQQLRVMQRNLQAFVKGKLAERQQGYVKEN
ncbi:hypothetical protein ABBQ38_008039 [Trebouxia sp. C0009 RCD-2024]